MTLAEQMPDNEEFVELKRNDPEFIKKAWKVGDTLHGSGKVIITGSFIVASFEDDRDVGLVATYSIFKRQDIAANAGSLESWQIQVTKEDILSIKHRMPNASWEVFGPEQDLPLEQQEIINIVADNIPERYSRTA